MAHTIEQMSNSAQQTRRAYEILKDVGGYPRSRWYAGKVTFEYDLTPEGAFCAKRFFGLLMLEGISAARTKHSVTLA